MIRWTRVCPDVGLSASEVSRPSVRLGWWTCGVVDMDAIDSRTKARRAAVGSETFRVSRNLARPGRAGCGLLRRSWILAIAGGLVMLAGCGGGSSSGPANPSVTQSSTTGQTSSPSASNGPLHLLYISDSSGYQVASLYAKQAEKALRRQVRVTDWTTNDLTAQQALAMVKSHPGVVANAEIIVVAGLGPDLGGPRDAFGAVCMQPGAEKRQPPKIYTVADWAAHRADLDALYAGIWKLRSGAPTVLRATDIWVPVISEWRLAGIEKACTAGWESFSGVERAAAQANGARFVSVYDVFNGPGHQQDPRKKGYIGPDGVHASLEGAAVIAATLAAAGFAPDTMPAH